MTLAFRLSTVGSGLAVIVSVGKGVNVNVGINDSVGSAGVGVSVVGLLVNVMPVVGDGVMDVGGGCWGVESVHEVEIRVIRIRIVPFFILTLYYRLSS